MALYDGLIAWLLRIVSTVDFCRIILYFAHARALPLLFARIWLSVCARTIAALRRQGNAALWWPLC
jgi:hypothetical protein